MRSLFLSWDTVLPTGKADVVGSYRSGATLKALWVIPLMLIYIFLIDIVGFYATTCLFIFIFMWFFGARQSLGFYIYPVVVPFVVYLVIGRFLHFPFPEGVFF